MCVWAIPSPIVIYRRPQVVRADYIVTICYMIPAPHKRRTSAHLYDAYNVTDGRWKGIVRILELGCCSM